MKLSRLEIRNYRSVKEQHEEDPIILDGLDCFIGKNNAGKSNILCAIKFLFGKDSKEDGEELFFRGNENLEIDVRGYFEVSEKDLKRVEEDKREKISSLLIEGNLGICKIVEDDKQKLQLLREFPKSEKLSEDKFKSILNEKYEEHTRANFRDEMKDEYPELIDYLRDDKEKNKGEWEDAYEKLIRDQPDDIEFEVRIGDFPSGTQKAIKNKILPRLIDIPAVKEAEDAAKTSNRSELGKLLNEVSNEIEKEVNEAIKDSMEDVHQKLNSGDGGERLGEIEELEERLSSYVGETFKDHSISLNFPKPNTQMMFKEAELNMKEEGMGEISLENTGEGLKRTLIFSLFRTLADLQLNEFEFQGEEEQKRPLLIIYEEADLFLHPGLQRTLLGVFDELKESGNQVLFSTHSPFLIHNRKLDTINIVRKDGNKRTGVTQFHEKLDELDESEESKVLEIQNISSYIFSDKVVLVEGKTDEIVLRKLSRKLNKEWDFDEHSISILRTEGKYKLPLFKNFLESIGITTFVMTDLDVLKKTAPKLVDSNKLERKHQKLKQASEDLQDDEDFLPNENRDFVDDMVESYDWADVFENLRMLRNSLNDITELEVPLPPYTIIRDEELQSLQKLLDKKYQDAWKQAIKSDHEDVKELREEFRKECLEEKVLILKGELEDYYADPKPGKMASAIEFDASKYEEKEIKSNFEEIKDGETDVEIFLKSVFDN